MPERRYHAFVTHLKFWDPNHIFGMREARDFKFGMHADADDYYRLTVVQQPTRFQLTAC